MKASAYAATGLEGLCIFSIIWTIVTSNITQRKIFSQSYDSCEIIQAKEIMELYSVTKLVTCDLVCVEVQMKSNKDGENQYKWVEWKMKLDLKAIY